ncbi:MAG: ribosome-associated translation inhibitor RaiA [Planctomycetes bacterium]|nr:ribosome-associated translation inhibitor RaiA [Planctomycetota bacterium]
MQIEVTLRDDSIGEDMKRRAEEKAQRLLKFYDKIQSVRVILDKTGEGYSCEMIADLERMHDLVAETTDRNLQAAIDQTFTRLERQIVEYKDRTRHHKGRGPNPHQPSRV